MSKFLESKKGSKLTATELIKTAKAQQQKMKDINNKLRVFLDEAAAENAEEGEDEEEDKLALEGLCMLLQMRGCLEGSPPWVRSACSCS